MKIICTEFEVWSKPGQLLDPDYGKLVLQPLLWGENIPAEVFLGVSNIPDELDCNNLKIDINAGVLNLDEFNKFCGSRNLMIDICNKFSACRFLEYKYGKCIGWIHYPVDENAQLMTKLSALIVAAGHLIKKV